MSINDWNIDQTWTLFLDRDGVINERIFGGYITRPEDFNFISGVEEAIVLLSEKFHLLLVVTNQQGIGKGLMEERNLLEIHTYMCDQIHRKGGKIDRCYFAPNLRGAEDNMRKPSPAMAELAKMEYPEIDYSRSVMVGDTDSDILFGKNLGMRTVRIQTDEPIGVEADLTTDSLTTFAKMITHEI
ncbi:MAG: HAD-IIIA family hydrolase [Crocinitomicaceae bacterium]|nr:HAD-IIIA family hydrolase [Crocinitomicaceae bacterium]